jgi:hypothetical protein
VSQSLTESKREINELRHHPALINDWAVIKKFQTGKMVNSDPVLRDIALGTIAALQYDIAQTHARFQKALQAAGGLCWIVQLYATALNNICWPYEANDLLFKSYSRSPNELSLLTDTIESCVNTGRAFRGEQLLGL